VQAKPFSAHPTPVDNRWELTGIPPVKRLTAAIFVTLAGCSDASPLRIAVVGGDGVPLAAELAAEDINASGGINGRLLEIEVVDEPPDVTPQDAITTAERLASDPGILAVIGHGGSSTSLAGSQVYNARGVPQLAPTTSSPLYTRAGPFSFRLVASDEHQAEFIAAHVKTLTPRPTVGILYVNDDYGRALREVLVQRLRRDALLPAYDAPYLPGETFAETIDGILRSLVNARVDLLIWIGLSSELQQLRPVLRSRLPRVRVLASDGASFIGAAADLAPYADDWLVAYADMSAPSPALQGVAARFAPLSGRGLTDAAALTYDAVGIVAEALRSGALTRQRIQRALTARATDGTVYSGITGNISFDENGDANPSYVMLRVGPAGARAVGR
jgi:branched-chain amino acid transport system substrate-binding protein